jgi:soluble lytic murein transglycosylase-like protein
LAGVLEGAEDSAGLVETPVPAPLTAADVVRYRNIFNLQAKGRWRAADREIRALEDPLLLGHLLAQRYLHPTAYRSKYSELAAWMAKYADHPDARRIHWLALRRQPKGAHSPKPPLVRTTSSGWKAANSARKPAARQVKRLSAKERRKARKNRGVILSRVRRGWPTGALAVLQDKDVGRLYSRVAYDRLRTSIAEGYFLAGKYKEAFEQAHQAADRSGEEVAESRWMAGLAGWRLGHFNAASRYFEGLARTEATSEWLLAAGAYWAARAYHETGQAEKMQEMLTLSAVHSRTFYGLLARRELGLPLEFQWDMPRLTQADLGLIVAEPDARRALALIQVGQMLRAERELIGLHAGASPKLARALLALTTRVPLPALSLRVGYRISESEGTRQDGASYPLPDWQPVDGFRIDRALLFAVMRQESAFNIRALSRSGARGLMQLMPGTAAFIAGRRFRGHEREQLFEPGLNLALGQKYLRYLILDEKIRGSLFMVAAAYNGGPGNLARWRRRIAAEDDPLLFIESIPSRETRAFIEKVLANLWIYRERLGQPAPSLDLLAAGGWPVYIPLDKRKLQVVADGKDRREQALSSR